MSDPFQENLNRADAAAKAGDWVSAEPLFREALRQQPGILHAARGLGNSLISLKKFDEAETVWRMVADLKPDSAEAQQMLGLIVLRRRDIEGATMRFTQALALNPAMPESAFNLGRIAYISNDRVRAAEFFGRAAAIEPTHIKAVAALTQTLTELAREADAIEVAAQGLMALAARPAIKPAAGNEIRHHMAHAYRRLNDIPNAAECYRAILIADPNDNVARHLLAAAEGNATDAHVNDFAKVFFDNLAENFDKHLVERLGYGSPAILVKDLLELHPEGLPAVLDLGCGTGLMGQALTQAYRIKHLVGIDLSEKMLHEAAKRGLYSELIAADVVAGMRERTDTFDLIVAADVFVYVGDLAPVFAQAMRLLRPGGLFAFTAEISSGPDVELGPNGHYHHARAYIARLAVEQGFAVVRSTDQPIRKEAHSTVLGHYAYLAKPV